MKIHSLLDPYEAGLVDKRHTVKFCAYEIFRPRVVIVRPKSLWCKDGTVLARS